MTRHQNDNPEVPREAGPPEGIPHVPDVTIPKIAVAAFCETTELAAAVEAAAADRRMSRADVSVMKGGIDNAISLYRKMPSPNLVLIETGSGKEDLLDDLEALSRECVAGTRVIVIGHANDVGLYRELVEKGVSDYLVTPLEPISLIGAISRCFRDTQVQKLGRITAFVGARGGAGSSTVAHNVAVALATRNGSGILLADMDLQFGTVGLDFDIEQPHGVADILSDSGRVDDVLLDRLAVKHSERLHILPSVPALDKSLSLKAEGFERLLAVAHSSARHLVLDMPDSWTPWVKETLLNADEIVITAAPDLASMRNAKNMIEFLKNARPNDVPPRLVLNQLGLPKRPEIKPAEFAAAVGIEPSVSIPFDAHLFGKASNDGRTVTEMAPRSKPSEAFHELARTISGQKELRRRSRFGIKGLMGRLKGRRWSDK
jgi:pilus assembly protein CpaE